MEARFAAGSASGPFFLGEALKADGTLAALLTEWIADKASAPVLK